MPDKNEDLINAYQVVKQFPDELIERFKGGDLKILREHLPNTFLNIRLDPVTLNDYSEKELESTIVRLVSESGNPELTGVCCINMDDKVEDSKITTIFQTVANLRQSYQTGN